MKDDPAVGCGYGVTFRGWAAKACAQHDLAYMTGSAEQRQLSRAEVDQRFYRSLIERAKRSRWPNGALVMAGAMYAVVRGIGWAFWEGRR